MYVDVTVLDQECVPLACLMADRGMEHLITPPARSPQEKADGDGLSD
ncbi:hypothetical protein ACGFYV_01920 [Streptomyces sp. NPDC048297]